MDCAGSNTLGHTGGGGGLTLGAHRCRSYTSDRNVRTVEELKDKHKSGCIKNHHLHSHQRRQTIPLYNVWWNCIQVFLIGCSYIIHSIFIFLEICYVMILSNLNRIFIYEACVSKHQRTKIKIWPNFSFQNHESLKTLKKEWKWLIFTTEGENGKLFIGVPFGVRASNKESFPFLGSLSMSSGLISVRITPCSNSTMSLGCSL